MVSRFVVSIRVVVSLVVSRVPDSHICGTRYQRCVQYSLATVLWTVVQVGISSSVAEHIEYDLRRRPTLHERGSGSFSPWTLTLDRENERPKFLMGRVLNARHRLYTHTQGEASCALNRLTVPTRSITQAYGLPVFTPCNYSAVFTL